jgi:DNA-binding NarL/FixJ family response regulator
MTNIAIIQDNASFALGLAEHFSRTNGFRITLICDSAETALKSLRAFPVDVAIIDIGLKGDSGIWLMEQIQAENIQTKCLVLSNHHDDEHVFDAFNAGASGYLLKTASLINLIEALHDLLKGGIPMSPSVSYKLVQYFRQLHRKSKKTDPSLSTREVQIMYQISRGLLYKEIAATLGIERETVKKHLSRIYSKLHVQNKIEAINKFYGN